MELTESTFSGTSDRVKQDEEAQKQATEQSLHTIEGAEEHKSPLPSSKDAPGSGLAQAKDGANGASGEDDEDTPQRLPAVKAEKTQTNPSKPPVTPRKNVIPSRRATFDHTRGTVPSSKGVVPTGVPTGNSPATNSDKQADMLAAPNQVPASEATRLQAQHASQTPDEMPSPETSHSQNQSEIPPNTADQPARTALPAVANVDASANQPAAALSTNSSQPASTITIAASDRASTHDNLSTANEDTLESNQADNPPVTNAHAFAKDQAADLPSLANLSATYHDTSAAEAAWQATDLDDEIAEKDTHILASAPQTRSVDNQPRDRQSTAEIEQREAMAAIATKKMATPVTPLPPIAALPVESATLDDLPTTPLPVFAPVKPLAPQRNPLTRKRALLLIVLLAIILVNASAVGFNQFFGPQGWGSVWNSRDNGGPNLLTQIAQQLQHSPTPGSKGTTTAPTPTQIVNLLMSNMTLDEKLGQMMMVQFMGQSYSPALDTMISQYHVGSVLYFQFNIGSKSQLTGLNAEMQHNANLPLLVAVDQEGGTVDRLINLDGAQPSASQIGASNHPNVAYQQGIKDAHDLASYGFNLNLAPVVDVNNVYNSQLYGRTYGNNPAIVSQMAEKYLEGLQYSGKVLGTLKHFPGLGDVSTDPHYGLPALTRDLNSLNTIDWAPYSNLIKQGHVASIMVTHEIVDAVDKTEPSSLSPQVIGILRKQMHFQGVIITDSLTMDSIHNFYTYGDAAAKAVEAGDDILMGADSPSTLAQMITGIKQAMNAGTITQQHIDDSVRRILLFKYEMGLLHV